MIKLGTEVKDKITGFKGIATGRCEYLTGCTQWLIIPTKLTKEGKRPEGEWFDEQRLIIVSKKVITIDNTATPGCDISAPKD